MSKISLALKIFAATFLIGNPSEKIENFHTENTDEIVKAEKIDFFTSIHPTYKNINSISKDKASLENDTVHILKTINGGWYMIHSTNNNNSKRAKNETISLTKEKNRI